MTVTVPVPAPGNLTSPGNLTPVVIPESPVVPGIPTIAAVLGPQRRDPLLLTLLPTASTPEMIGL